MRQRLALLALLPAIAVAQPTPGAGSAAQNSGIRKATVLASKGMIGAIGGKAPLKATLTAKADGRPVAGKTVSFTVAGKNAGTATTGATGEATLEYRVPNDPPPGPHPMEARFAGDGDWAPASIAANFDVVKAETKVRFPVDTGAGPGPPKGVNEGESVRMVGTLTRKGDGENIDGRVIVITVNGERKARLTTSGGYGFFTFDWTVPAAFAPKATVQAQFEGDVLYLPDAATTEFKVYGKARPAQAKAANASGKFGETFTLKAILLDITPPVPKFIAGQKVRIEMDAVDWSPAGACEGTTNELGEAACRINFEVTPGDYYLKAYAELNEGIWKIDNENTPTAYLHVAKAPTHLALSGPDAAQIGQRVSVKARLTRTTDSKPIVGEPVGASGETTDAAGSVTVQFSIPSTGTGLKTFKVPYAGSLYYEPTEGSITIHVKPSTK